MKINYKHQHVIDYLIQNVVHKSNMRCKHAAALVDNKGNIISTGYNYMIITNQFSNRLNKKIYSIHAERDCLSKCNKKKINGCDLVVIRYGCDRFLLSQPCKDCERLINIYIKKYKLKNVYYSIEN